METKLNYTTREINHNMKIKVYGQGINKAVGVRGFLAIIDDIELCNRLLDRAFRCRTDKQECRLRRGPQRGVLVCVYNGNAVLRRLERGRLAA